MIGLERMTLGTGSCNKFLLGLHETDTAIGCLLMESASGTVRSMHFPPEALARVTTRFGVSCIGSTPRPLLKPELKSWPDSEAHRWNTGMAIGVLLEEIDGPGR